MQIPELKLLEEAYTPLLLFECTLADGSVERWCTHKVSADGHMYEARVLGHSGFEFRLAGEDGLDLGNRLTLRLANVDGRISQIDGAIGWRGARLLVRFGFFDLRNGVPMSSRVAVFAGVANPAEELTEDQARLTFLNRLGLSRLQVPQLRIQSRCPWRFPSTQEERQSAVDGGTDGKYSPFYRCGYSPDMPHGRGNMNDAQPFTTCGYTREDCRQRGMYDMDAQGRKTARFGGFDFLPSGLWVRPHGAKESQWSEPLDGRARPNDAVPLVYGTAWIEAPVIFARDDGNLTHCEVIIGIGPIEAIRKVVANGVEIPLADDSRDMSGTGWYRLLTRGDREGDFNWEFIDGSGAPMGNPHGSIASVALVLPNQIVDRGRLPRVEVLVDGLRLPRYNADGTIADIVFTRNPAWVLLDLLRLAGWRVDEIDIQSFVETAEFCDEFIEHTGLQGELTQGPRYEVNLALTRRRSLSEVVRGVRLSSGLMITLDWAGRLQLRPETTLRRQHPSRGAYSNAATPLNGGWPAFEFGDGSNGLSGIIRHGNGNSTFRLLRRSAGEVPNRLTVEFADGLRNYEPDVLSLVDFEDARLQGCEVSAPLGALGLPHFGQAARILRLHLEKNIEGNQYIEFETSVQAFGLRPGDIVTVSHQRHGFDRTPFRILKLTAGLNFHSVKITAQKHVDAWYERVAGDLPSGDTSNVYMGGIPNSLAGKHVGSGSVEEYLIEEPGGAGDGAVEIAVHFTPPAKPILSGPRPPLVSLAPDIESGSGTLRGGRTLYYALTTVDGTGQESGRSFVVEARLASGSDGYAVSLKGIQLPAGAASMRVYRGESPSQLRRIAEALPSGGRFTDTGLESTVIPLPDPNFDHARFHWRLEYLPPTATDLYGATKIGNSALGLLPDAFKGALVRILRGRGAGQERVITQHSATEIHVSPPWRLPPDASSVFTIAESSWRPAGTTRTDELRFVVPGGLGGAIQIQGIAVSSRGMESPENEALIGRHELSLSGAGDSDVPPEPSFGISTPGRGAFVLSGIGFPTLTNTRTIRTGTLTVYYWDELQSPTSWHLAQPLNGEDRWVYASGALGVEQGDLLQIEAELLRVLEVHEGGLELLVDRGIHDTEIVPHSSQTPIFPLRRLTNVVAFSRGLFGSPASGSYSRRFDLPNARLAAAELYVTNDRGASPTAFAAYTATEDGGLRTMAGGQYTFQYDGELAILESISPPLIVESTRAVRDILAQVERAPQGSATVIRVLVDDATFAEVAIQPGEHEAEPVVCFNRAPLLEGSKVVVSVVSVGTGPNSYPGKGLSVTMRL